MAAQESIIKEIWNKVYDRVRWKKGDSYGNYLEPIYALRKAKNKRQIGVQLMNEPVTVTYSLEEMFARLEQKIESNQKETNEKFKEISNKLETIQKDITDLKVGQPKLTEKVEGIDDRLKIVEGTQKNQVWALIVLLAGAIATAGAKLFFTTNP